MSKRGFSVLKNALGRMVVPTEYTCISCGRDVFDELGFCAECIKDVVFNNGKTCMRCGVGIDGEEDYCGNCSFDKVYFDRSYAVFSYEGAIQRAVLDIKFNNKGDYTRVLARYLAYYAVKHKLQFDAVCFPPMSRQSLRKRRYNQSQLLAAHFCDIMNCKVRYIDALVKVKETKRQETLSKTERKGNLTGAFKVSADVKDKNVLIIDDVKTTGATLNECAKVLKKAGAATVIGLTVSARKEQTVFEEEQEANVKIKE